MTFDEWINDNKEFLHDSTILGDLRLAFNAGRPKWYRTKDGKFPKQPGNYLVWRDFNGRRYPEILAYDGRFWITGNDHPNNIIAWCEIPNYAEEELYDRQ